MLLKHSSPWGDTAGAPRARSSSRLGSPLSWGSGSPWCSRGHNLACASLLKTQGPGAACGPWTLEGTGLPSWQQDWAQDCGAGSRQGAGAGEGGQLLGMGAARLWPVQGRGQAHQPPRQSWPGRGELYLTHVHKYSLEGEAGEEGALLFSTGSCARHVCGVLRERRTGLPGREVGWLPLVMEGILHASGQGRGV